MANVLPKDALSTVRGFYRARFLLVGSLVAIACGVLALLALMPVYATVSAERLAESDPLSQVSLPPSSDRDDIARAQVLVKELLPVASSTVSALHVLEGILSARPAGVKLSNVRYMRGEEGTIVVSGTAPSRHKINSSLLLAKG